MFHTTEVDFLGMIVRHDRIKMDQEKVKAILEWPELKTVKGVRSFLRLANFYWRFIKDYAKVARPLHDLTKKKNPFHWEEPQQVAFDTLKLHFTTAPILAFPDIHRLCLLPWKQCKQLCYRGSSIYRKRRYMAPCCLLFPLHDATGTELPNCR